MKKKKAEFIGMKAEIIFFPQNTPEKEIINSIHKLNQTSNGIIVQLPLPKHLDTDKIVNTINPKKDVDGLTVENLGKVFAGKEFLVQATPCGIIKLLEEYKIPIKGKEVVVIGRSNLLGKPLAAMLLNRNATVTICHRYTKDLEQKTKLADILYVGIGKPNFIKKEMIKENTVIIDSGISKINGKIIGDVDFEDVEDKASFITPVPGGIGPMTVASLLENVYFASQSK